MLILFNFKNLYYYFHLNIYIFNFHCSHLNFKYLIFILYKLNKKINKNKLSFLVNFCFIKYCYYSSLVVFDYLNLMQS